MVLNALQTIGPVSIRRLLDAFDFGCPAPFLDAPEAPPAGEGGCAEM